MYFFYIDESGTKDVVLHGRDDHLYVLTAVSLYEFHWKSFEREITNFKLGLSDSHFRKTGERFDLARCEVKSTWLRMPKQRAAESPFLHALSDADRTKMAEKYYGQLRARRMSIFSVVVDKRKLHSHVDQDILFKMAYEFLLERIEHFLEEYHPKHQGMIIIDDNSRQANRSLALKHAYIQREGNRNLYLRHIVEYPLFTDSALSNGIQMADLCGYNVYRAFRNMDFAYPYFERMLPNFYTSGRTSAEKLDGLKVWPDDSDLIGFAESGWLAYLKKQPALKSGL